MSLIGLLGWAGVVDPLEGETVTYANILQNSPTDANQTPFGAPTVDGDSLVLDPTGFDSSSAGNLGVDQTSGNLNFRIGAKDGYGISSLSFSEEGQYNLQGTGASAFANVSLTVFVDVFEIDGVAVNTINLDVGQMTYSPSDGDFNITSDGPTPIQGTWNGSLTIDVDQMLADLGHEFDRGATAISVNLGNTLVTLSGVDTSAEISKTDWVVTANTGGPEIVGGPTTKSISGIIVQSPAPGGQGGGGGPMNRRLPVTILGNGAPGEGFELDYSLDLKTWYPAYFSSSESEPGEYETRCGIPPEVDQIYFRNRQSSNP